MLTVNREQTCPGPRRGAGRKSPRRDERFLVGQRHCLTAFKGSKNRRQAGKTHDTGDNNIDGPPCQFGAGILSNNDFDSRPGQCASQFRGMILGCKPDYFGAMTQRLLGQKTGVGSRHENFHIELIRAGFDKREGAGTNRSGRPEN